jgi:hypothetical protein
LVVEVPPVEFGVGEPVGLVLDFEPFRTPVVPVLPLELDL